MKSRLILAFSIIGGIIVVYSIVLLGIIATTPDLGIRCLMADRSDADGQNEGIVIRDLLVGPNGSVLGPHPSINDRLIRIDDTPIHSFVDFTRTLMLLRSKPIPAGGGSLPVNADPSELKQLYPLPTLVGDVEGNRFVEIEFIPHAAANRQPLTCYLKIQSLPLLEVLASLGWFVLQSLTLAISAAVYWNRPFDRASQLFFALCIVTLGAFLGSNYWWVVSGSFWMTAPSVLCAMLLPAVCLHFFLVFPRVWLPLVWRPRTTLALIYGLPVAGAATILTLVAVCHGLPWRGLYQVDVPTTRTLLSTIRSIVYAALLGGGVYFTAALACIRRSYGNTRNEVERVQLRLLWWSGVGTTLCMIAILYYAFARREDFALGAARIPIYLAGLCFTLAYAYGIIRYRLLLVDQIVAKGVLYYLSSIGLTAAFALMIALGPLVPRYFNISLLTQQSALISVVLMLAVILLLWIRDAFQGMIDRRFYREKYQLDKALERMNRAVGQLADPEAVAELMLSSCRDVLAVDRAALYLRSTAESPLRLVAAIGGENLPRQLAEDHPLVVAVAEMGNVQRMMVATRAELNVAQTALRELRIDLAHALQVGTTTTGLVLLGGKQGSAGFSGEDLTFLNALGQITNVALYTVKGDQDLQQLNEELRRKIERIETQTRQISVLHAELSQLQRADLPEAAKPGEFERNDLKGKSPPIERVLDTVRKVASSESSVLVRGESGTGKELVARILHENSPRREGPMISVHCASLSAGLLESELFGHVKGSFTGAHRDRMGRFQAASGGTLFLDEIGDISLDTQVKLLRVLQERCFEPVGGTQTVHVDVRMIAATHQNLEDLIAQGRFREDLYYRLNVISISMPALRERNADILELALHFLQRSATKCGKRISHIDPEALNALERYPWPGNIRELENVIERAVVLAETEQVTLQDLPPEVTRPSRGLPRTIEPKRSFNESELEQPTRYSDAAPSWERKALLDALHKCGGNKAEAARLLGLPRSTYFSKLKKHRIG